MASTPVPSEHPKPTPAKDQPTESHELQSAGQTTTEEPTNNGIDDQSSRLPFPRLMTAYLCLSAIYFISTLDINSVAMALPAISRSLGVGSSVTWTGTAYLMGQTAFQVLYGRLSDIFGRKPVLVSCICFLIFGDLLCGFAQNATWLYICRALSGVGGGGISSLVQITVSDLVSLKDRGKYQGMLSGSIGLGASAGPFLAAGMLHRDPRDGWRWIFRIPPVLAAVCAGVMWICLPQKAVSGSWREKVRKIDWVGLLVAVAAVLFFLIPVNSGGSIWPWNSSLVISMLVLGGVLSIIFGVVEKRFAAFPLVPLRLFGQASTASIYIQSALYNAVWQVDMYFLPIYFQDVRGYSPVKSASLVLPLLLLQSVAGVLSGPIMTRLSRYGPVLYGGMALWVLGAGLKVLFSRSTPVSVYVVVLMIEGIGIGFVLQPALVALQALSKPEDRAVAISSRNLMRMLGSVMGMALATSIQFSVMKAALPHDLPHMLREQVSNGSWERGESSSREWDSAILDAKMKGTRAVFIMLVPFMAVCLLGCYFIPSKELRGDRPEDGAREQRPHGQNVV